MTQNIHYFCHFHRPSLPHAQAMIQSLRQLDDSPITCVCDPDCYAAFSESDFVRQMGNLLPVPMHVVETECAHDLPWGKWRSKATPRDLAWRMQACLPWWMLHRVDAEWIVYCDSDLFHFQPLAPIIEALPDTAHVAICGHHFPPGRENKSAGNWNNGLLAMRKSPLSIEHALRWGRETLKRWVPGHPREVAHEQKLLDEWPEQLGKACVELSRGCDIGPWQLPRIVPLLFAGPGAVGLESGERLQSWHMHEFRRGIGKNPVTLKGQQWNRSGYPLHAETIKSVYEPYERCLAEFL